MKRRVGLVLVVVSLVGALFVPVALAGVITLGEVSVSTGLVMPGEPVTVSTSFSNSDPTAVHTVVWNWGDGTTSIASVSESGGAGYATGSHTYTTPGTFVVAASIEGLPLVWLTVFMG